MAPQQQLLLTVALAFVLLCGAAAQPLSRAQLRPHSMRKLKLVGLDTTSRQTMPGSTPPAEPTTMPEEEEEEEAVGGATVTLEPVSTPAPEVPPSTSEAPAPETELMPGMDEELIASPLAEPVVVSDEPAQEPEFEPEFEEALFGPEEMAAGPEEEMIEPETEGDVTDLVAAISPEMEEGVQDMESDMMDLDEEANASGPGAEAMELNPATLSSVPTASGTGPLERSDLVTTIDDGVSAEDVRKQLQELAQQTEAKDG